MKKHEEKSRLHFQLVRRLLIMPFLVVCLALSLQPALAVDSDYQNSDDLEVSEKFSEEELAQMLAPIALYPDALLSQVLMASTYPIEVIEADRWVRENPELKGEELDEELLDKDWDPSVKAMCHFPSILELMSERVAETTRLGNAFLAQEAEVMDMVQELRTRAYDEGNLATTSRQKVIVEDETIIIEPSDRRFVYVPYYDTAYIYGRWWHPGHPPHHWRPRGVSFDIGISYWPNFYFGFIFGAWSHFDWHRHHIYINVHKRPGYVKHDRWHTKPGRWHHQRKHRRGIAYHNKSTARQYGHYTTRARNSRREVRGLPERRDRGIRNSHRKTIEHGRQERKHVVRNQPVQQKVDKRRKERKHVVRERSVQQRVDRKRQERKHVARNQPVQQQPDKIRKERRHVARERSAQQTSEERKEWKERKGGKRLVKVSKR